MSVHKDDPNLALVTLHKLADEIPSGVSVRDVGEVVPVIGPNPGEITNNLRELIAAKLRDNLSGFWESQNINEKLKNVRKLECSDLEKRWPTSMQEIVNSLRGKELRCLKKNLNAKIKKIIEENNKLEATVKEKSELLEQQLNQMNSFQFTL
ncbi:uncharacterized protein LOC123011098 [Tribolium madens]|uniref:uncharacterized protein LOC123011098 n=1 Tax=Tribolium madens TaxID=41895 RepID=UPI001CF74DB0|nr:uncharacterized protein LOC123011098 [Tribolium madens]